MRNPLCFAVYVFLILMLATAGTPLSQTQANVVSLDFSGTRAYEHLKRQVAIGARVPGTPEHERAVSYIKGSLKLFADSILEQRFTAETPQGKTPMTNVIAYLNKDAERFILLGAHFDTRPFADMDSGANRTKPIPGANDGASGVAVLLELARALHGKLPDNFGVLLVFFDGEDFGSSLSTMFYGSRHFARNLSPELRRKISYAVVIDMVGDADLAITRETASESSLPWFFNSALKLQSALGVQALLDTGAIAIYDDHLPLIDAGVKSYLLIDFVYPYWHTLEDTPDKCSPESLQSVGLILLNLILNYANRNVRPG